MFLAIDSVFDQCSVAVMTEDLQVVSCDTQTGKRLQTQQILPMIKVALQNADISLSQLNALIFNRGPGAFSGIRINTSVVQALSVAHDLPCVGVSSLAAIAQAAYDTLDSDVLNSSASNSNNFEQVYVALDARMKQVYFGEYQAIQHPRLNCAIMTQVADQSERLLDYESETLTARPIVGDGAPLLKIHPNQLILPDIHPDAVNVGKLGVASYLQSGGAPAEQALPVYLRNDAWRTLKEQKEHRQSL